jgi:6-phosphogluconolactonase
MSPIDFTRRDFMEALHLAMLGLVLPGPILANSRPNSASQELVLYVGTYTSGKSEGVYIYRMDLSSGELRHFRTIKGVANPSFLAIDGQRRHLYAVNELREFEGKPGGAVSAFSIDQHSGDLQFLNQKPSLGVDPCHLIVDGTGRFVLVANYGGGNIAVFPVQKDGSLGAATDLVQHRGAGPNAQRQEGPHAHCIVLDSSDRYAFAVDLGIDKIMIYRFDDARGKLTANKKESSVQLRPGAGPRHFTFHPNGRYAYVINELDSTVTAFSYDSANGTLKARQTVSTLPNGFAGANDCAEIHVSPSGRFLYGSNRGHNSIVVFQINEHSGDLEFVEHVSTQGKTPRDFTIDPTGTFLLAANQESDTVVSFRIDSGTGRLKPTGHVTEVPTPVCLKLIPAFA